MPNKHQKTVRRAHKSMRKHSDAVNCSTDSILINPIVRAILVIVFFGTDFAALSMLLDQVLTENVFLSFIFTFSATLAYNYLPIVIANEVHAIRNNKNHKPYWLVGYVSLFCVVVGLTATLRVTTKELLFASVFTGSEDYSSIMGSLSVSADSLTASIAVLFMAIIPVATSLISLYLNLKDSPQAVKLRKLIAARKALEGQLVTLTAQRAKLDRDYEGELRAWDELSRKSFLEKESCEAENIKNYYQTLLAMLTKSPDALNFITEKPLKPFDAVTASDSGEADTPDETST